MSQCIVTIPSMTFAQKARKVLTANRMEAIVVKLTPEQADKGCGWGIEADCSQTDEIARILDISDIPWRRILRR